MPTTLVHRTGQGAGGRRGLRARLRHQAAARARPRGGRDDQLGRGRAGHSRDHRRGGRLRDHRRPRRRAACARARPGARRARHGRRFRARPGQGRVALPPSRPTACCSGSAPADNRSAPRHPRGEISPGDIKAGRRVAGATVASLASSSQRQIAEPPGQPIVAIRRQMVTQVIPLSKDALGRIESAHACLLLTKSSSTSNRFEA